MYVLSRLEIDRFVVTDSANSSMETELLCTYPYLGRARESVTEPNLGPVSEVLGWVDFLCDMTSSVRVFVGPSSRIIVFHAERVSQLDA